MAFGEPKAMEGAPVAGWRPLNSALRAKSAAPHQVVVAPAAGWRPLNSALRAKLACAAAGCCGSGRGLAPA